MNLSPGIYKGTIRGVPDVTFLIDVDSHGAARVTPHRIDGNWWHGQDDITDARRLYTLDIEDHAEVVWRLRESHLNFIADQIEAQIPKPPRMDEPGWGEKVTASTKIKPWRRQFVGVVLDGSLIWVDPAGSRARWDNLIDPEPVQS